MRRLATRSSGPRRRRLPPDESGRRLTGEPNQTQPTAPEDPSGADLRERVADLRERVTDLRERVVDSKVLHRGKFVEFRIDTIERADGSRAVRDWAGHPGAVAIVALDAAGRVALVRQWRLAAHDALLEIPAGGLDMVDGAKEDPDVAARRELEEETGMRAATWRKLAEFFSAPGFTDELMHLYLATDLSPADPDGRLGPDEDERLILEWRPWREAVTAVEGGEIRDAKSVAGLFWLARVLGED
jgi:ADP-ribose pyrophosphatase